MVVQRRAVYSKRPIKGGMRLVEQDIVCLRPALNNGISAWFYTDLLGRKVMKDIEEGQLIEWSAIEH